MDELYGTIKALTIQFGKIGRVQKVISGGGQKGGGVEAGHQWVDTFSCKKQQGQELLKSCSHIVQHSHLTVKMNLFRRDKDRQHCRIRKPHLVFN